ncbi:MAG: HIT family protein [Rhodospirillales bacterium]|nr:MAG: HIT family protein [Rhodospirillales bacterium]
MSSKPDCIFCQIVAGAIPCFKLYEDEATLAFMDINPVHPGHALAIVKPHYADLFATPADLLAATTATLQKVATAVQTTLKPPGMNLLQCNGPAAAQSVPHFHMHAIPRHADDGLAMNWDLVPGNHDDIAALAERIRANL